jgi:hypothetical protein
MAQRPDPYELDGVRSRASQRSFPWLIFLLLVLSFALVLLFLSPFPEKVRRELGLSSSPDPVELPPKVETRVIYKDRVIEKIVVPKGSYYQVEKGIDIARTSSGFDFKSGVTLEPGGLASAERERPGSYAANFMLVLAEPKAAITVEEVQKVNPNLSDMLPGLPRLLETAKVSHFYTTLYQNKAERLQASASQLDELLSKHNYYDCQTMLQMEHPVTKRMVFLMQSDMDVVADGSDGDRLAQMPDEIVNSTHYQPFTSYGWPKTGAVGNPMANGWKTRVEAANKELADPATTSTRKVWLRDRIKMLRRGIEDMQNRSFLIAEYDPFVVIPVNFIKDRDDPYGPNVGDYVCVIHGKKAYPAIVGDGGPTFKVGEGSLRLAKELNSSATPYNRPVSDVSVTYLIFPRSSGKWQAPNYAEWRSECAQLLEEIGGLGPGYELHIWEDKLPKKE